MDDRARRAEVITANQHWLQQRQQIVLVKRRWWSWVLAGGLVCLASGLAVARVRRQR